MAQTYIVKEVDGVTNDWSNKHGGHFTSYRCALEGVEGDVEVAKKQGNQGPTPGTELFGRLEPKTIAGYSWRFFAEQQQGAGGGNSSGGSRGDLSPEAQARIDAVGRVKARHHSQMVAATILNASGDLASVDFNDGEQANAFLNGIYKPLVDFLVKDAESARAPREEN